MRIFGRLWDDSCELGRRYQTGILAGVTVKFMVVDPLEFLCDLCGDDYEHWLCSDRVWKALPEVLHKRYICHCCFMAFRKYHRLCQQVKRKEKVNS